MKASVTAKVAYFFQRLLPLFSTRAYFHPPSCLSGRHKHTYSLRLTILHTLNTDPITKSRSEARQVVAGRSPAGLHSACICPPSSRAFRAIAAAGTRRKQRAVPVQQHSHPLLRPTERRYSTQLETLCIRQPAHSPRPGSSIPSRSPHRAVQGPTCMPPRRS